MSHFRAIALNCGGAAVAACIAAPFGYHAIEAVGVAWLICLPALVVGRIGRVADQRGVSIISMKRGMNYAVAGMPIRLAWVLGIAAGLYSRFGERWGMAFWPILIAFYESTLLLIVARVKPHPGAQSVFPSNGPASALSGRRGGDRSDDPG